MGLHSSRRSRLKRYWGNVSKGLCGKCGKEKISEDSISSCNSCLKLVRGRYHIYKRKSI